MNTGNVYLNTIYEIKMVQMQSKTERFFQLNW